MLRISNIKMPVKHTENTLKGVTANLLNIKIEDFKSFEIAGQAIDARNKGNVVYVYSVDVELDNEEMFKDVKNVRKIEKQPYEINRVKDFKGKRPVVIGSGPAGIFAALIPANSRLR